jgi:class 3 adenylate cyclase
MAQQIPNAKLIEFPGIDHAVWIGEDWTPILDAVEEFVTGAAPVHDVDRILATVLFTDIVDSTSKQVELGDARWKETLNRHDEVVRREIDRHRGKRIKTTGDGVLATFDGPARGVRCALAILAAVAPLGIEVRAGLHTGEVELRGEDIGGIAVHIGQRVSALAGPREVFVSRTLTDLVAGSGLVFKERGEYDLKGIPGRWAIYSAESPAD